MRANRPSACGSLLPSRACSRPPSGGVCMKRSELEHLIRAAGRIAGAREIVVIGSQAVLGQFPEAPPALRRSMEADLYPKGAPELARHRMTDKKTLLKRLAATGLEAALTRSVRGRIERDFPPAGRQTSRSS